MIEVVHTVAGKIEINNSAGYLPCHWGNINGRSGMDGVLKFYGRRYGVGGDLMVSDKDTQDYGESVIHPEQK